MTKARDARIVSWRGTCSECGCSVSGGGVGIRPPRDDERVVCIACLPPVDAHADRRKEKKETDE